MKIRLLDLIIENLSFNPQNPELGQIVEIIASVKNQGLGDAPSNEFKYNINGTNETYNGEIPVSALPQAAGQVALFSELLKKKDK